MTEDEIVNALSEAAAGSNEVEFASPEAIAEAEQVIGFPLPPLLRRIYMEVANGGFGPKNGGVLGVPGAEPIDDWEDIVEAYQAFGSDPEINVPPGFVWLVDWGCAIWSIMDCSDGNGRMWGWDPNAGLDGALFPQNMNLAEWLTAYLDGSLVIPERPSE
jgi:hypothetical protein